MTARKKNAILTGSILTGSNLPNQAEDAPRNTIEEQYAIPPPPLEDWPSLLHKLRVRQIELEKQNEELRRVHAESEAERKRYAMLYDLSPVGYLTLSLPGIILEANLTAAQMLGIPRSQLAGIPLAQFVLGEDLYAYNHYLRSLGGPETTGILVTNLVKGDGVPFDARLEALTRDGQDIIQLVISDITGPKRAEYTLKEKNATLEQHISERTAELAESEHRYATIFDKSPIGFAVTKMPNGVIVDVNEAFLKQFEYSREEVIGKTSVDLGISDVDLKARIAAELQARGSVRDFECTRITKSGARCELSLNLDWVSIGGETHILTMVHDITKRKRSEKHISYEAWLLENINDAIVASDEQYRLTAWNTAAETLYGWRAEEALGRKGLDLLQTDFSGSDPEVMRRMIDEVGMWRGEVTQHRKDGSRIPVEVASIVLHDANGQVKGYVSVNRDITARKQAEEMLHRAYDKLEQREQERTHELNVINEEMKAEIAQRERVEGRLRLLSTALNAAANGIIITEFQGHILWANPAFICMTGFSLEEVLVVSQSE